MAFRLVVVWGWLSGLTAFAEEPLPDLALMRAQYLAATTSIHSLDCEMRIEWIRSHVTGPVSPESIHTAETIHLWKKGTRRAMLCESIDGNGRPSIATWGGYDGKLYGHWSRPLRSSDEQPWLPGGTLSAEKDNRLFESLTIDRLTGETLFAGDLPLGQLLTLPGTKVVGWEEVEGDACVRIQTPRHFKNRKFPNRLTNETTVWLSPKHQFLPRKIERRDHVNGLDKPPLVYTELTTAFEEHVGDDNRTYVIPTAGRRTSKHAENTVQVVRVRINPPLSDDLFRPQFPPLAEVWESLPNRPLRIRVVGDAKERERQLMDLAKKNKPLPPEIAAPAGTASLPPSAAPQDAARYTWFGRSWRVFVGIGLCATALIVVWIFRRHTVA